MDFWNFKDFMMVPTFYWFWLALAALAGFITAWISCAQR